MVTPNLHRIFFAKITALAMQQDTVPRTIDSFSIALDKDGNIANYRFSGGGGQLMFPYGTLLERKRSAKRQVQLKHCIKNGGII